MATKTFPFLLIKKQAANMRMKGGLGKSILSYEAVNGIEKFPAFEANKRNVMIVKVDPDYGVGIEFLNLFLREVNFCAKSAFGKSLHNQPKYFVSSVSLLKFAA